MKLEIKLELEAILFRNGVTQLDLKRIYELINLSLQTNRTKK